ncbi:MAG TPA: hypothetical protein DCS67_01420 [Clostridiales bacterium UBA8960]|jgi:hypothetical protein|nr:hypothetical protein [Clostridiales bacterium UBA8960]
MAKAKIVETYSEKSYKGLYLWLVGLVSVMIGFGTLTSLIGAVSDKSEMIKIHLLLAAFMIWLLFYVILKTERIYFIYGISYERAKVAGSKRRNIFAHGYLRVFSFATLLYAMVGALSTVLAWPFMTDLAAFLFLYGIAVIKGSKISL